MEANCLLAMSAVILTSNKCLTWNITWMFSIGNLVRSQARNRWSNGGSRAVGQLVMTLSGSGSWYVRVVAMLSTQLDDLDHLTRPLLASAPRTVSKLFPSRLLMRYFRARDTINVLAS